MKWGGRSKSVGVSVGEQVGGLRTEEGEGWVGVGWEEGKGGVWRKGGGLHSVKEV